MSMLFASNDFAQDFAEIHNSDFGFHLPATPILNHK